MMKKTKTILAVALVCTIPLGAFAYDKFDRDDHRKSSYCDDRMSYDKKFHDFEDDDFDLTYELIEKMGVNLAFEGKIEKKPTDGFNGVWKISGKEVVIDDSTKIFMEDKISLNEEVSILAKRENGKIIAVVLELD